SVCQGRVERRTVVRILKDKVAVLEPAAARRDLLVPVEKRTADVRPTLRDLEGKRNREIVDHDRGVPHAGQTLRVAELDTAENQQDHSEIPNTVRAEKRGDIHDGWSLPSNLL